MKRLILVILVFSLAAAMFARPGASITAQEGETNLTEGCVENYDPNVDYFPQKATVEYATGLEIDYFNNYKVIRATTPWPGSTAEDIFEYVLVQCGTPAPEGYADAQFIEVPTGDMIVMSTTVLPHLVALDLLDHLIGLDSFLYTNTPEVVEMIDSGKLIEVGGGAQVNVELALEAEPAIVMAYGNGAPEWDAHPALLDAGVFVAMNSEWVETSPLGRAEWIKFTAAFYNKEDRASEVFDAIVAEYEALRALTTGLADADKPLVLPNAFSSWDSAWNIPGADSYVAQLLRDAGAMSVLGDAPEVAGNVGSVQFSFEAVYEAGLDADIWITGVFGVNTLADLLALDERYADFAAVENGRVYNNSRRVNANGGNDFYETGVTDPQLILADLISIFHPELLPDHELIFYTRLE